MQRIVVWGMKCVSYDYEFESDLATKWKTLDRATPQSNTQQKSRGRPKKKPTSDYSEDEGDTPIGTSRDHLSRKVRREKGASRYGDSVSAGVFGDSEELSDEDEDYYDANVGDLS